MGSESLFRLVSLVVFGAVITACAALQQAPKAAAVSPALNPSAEIEVDSLTEVQQINSGQFRPYEMGSFKNFGDGTTGFETDPNL